MLIHLLKSGLAAAALTLVITGLALLWVNYTVRRSNRVQSWGVDVNTAGRLFVILYIACLLLFWFALPHR